MCVCVFKKIQSVNFFFLSNQGFCHRMRRSWQLQFWIIMKYSTPCHFPSFRIRARTPALKKYVWHPFFVCVCICVCLWVWVWVWVCACACACACACVPISKTMSVCVSMAISMCLWLYICACDIFVYSGVAMPMAIFVSKAVWLYFPLGQCIAWKLILNSILCFCRLYCIESKQ